MCLDRTRMGLVKQVEDRERASWKPRVVKVWFQNQLKLELQAARDVLLEIMLVLELRARLDAHFFGRGHHPEVVWAVQSVGERAAMLNYQRAS